MRIVLINFMKCSSYNVAIMIKNNGFGSIGTLVNA